MARRSKQRLTLKSLHTRMVALQERIVTLERATPTAPHHQEAVPPAATQDVAAVATVGRHAGANFDTWLRTTLRVDSLPVFNLGDPAFGCQLVKTPHLWLLWLEREKVTLSRIIADPELGSDGDLTRAFLVLVRRALPVASEQEVFELRARFVSLAGLFVQHENSSLNTFLGYAAHDLSAAKRLLVELQARTLGPTAGAAYREFKRHDVNAFALGDENFVKSLTKPQRDAKKAGVRPIKSKPAARSYSRRMNPGRNKLAR